MLLPGLRRADRAGRGARNLLRRLHLRRHRRQGPSPHISTFNYRTYLTARCASPSCSPCSLCLSVPRRVTATFNFRGVSGTTGDGDHRRGRMQSGKLSTTIDSPHCPRHVRRFCFAAVRRGTGVHHLTLVYAAACLRHSSCTACSHLHLNHHRNHLNHLNHIII